jgi:hypothetical protein
MNQGRENHVIRTLNRMEESPGTKIHRLIFSGINESDLNLSAEELEEYRVHLELYLIVQHERFEEERAIFDQDMEGFWDRQRRILAGETVERDCRWNSDHVDEYDESRRRVHRVQISLHHVRNKASTSSIMSGKRRSKAKV